MAEPFEAIYEGGVLRPLSPLSLPEQTRVEVTVRKPSTGGGSPLAAHEERTDEKRAAAQRAALLKLLEEVKHEPQQRNTDGWSVANRADDLLYGGPDGPA